MDLVSILKIVSIILGCLVSTIIPLSLKLMQTYKKKKAATSEAEKEAATNEMLIYVNDLITGAEALYKQVDTLMKANGLGSTGALKKESVMTKLQAFAIESGYTFDADYWSAAIDDIVTLTRKVNAK